MGKISTLCLVGMFIFALGDPSAAVAQRRPAQRLRTASGYAPMRSALGRDARRTPAGAENTHARLQRRASTSSEHAAHNALRSSVASIKTHYGMLGTRPNIRHLLGSTMLRGQRLQRASVVRKVFYARTDMEFVDQVLLPALDAIDLMGSNVREQINGDSNGDARHFHIRLDHPITYTFDGLQPWLGEQHPSARLSITLAGLRSGRPYISQLLPH